MDRAAKHSERDRRFAFKKRATQVLLQPVYGTCQRRLRDAAASGRPRETALLAEGQKIPNLMQLHHPLRIRCARTAGLPSDVGSGCEVVHISTTFLAYFHRLTLGPLGDSLEAKMSKRGSRGPLVAVDRFPRGFRIEHRIT